MLRSKSKSEILSKKKNKIQLFDFGVRNKTRNEDYKLGIGK